MLNEKEKEIVLQLARKYNVFSVLLFGSSLQEGVEANDIHLARD